MTVTTTEIESIESLDFDYEIECEVEDCSAKAEWMMHRACCDKKDLNCTPCTDTVKTWLLVAEIMGIDCMACGKTGLTRGDFTWTRL